VACPNPDVVYGIGVLALDVSGGDSVPDFGDRFWVYQAVDLRTDSFVQLGKMYDTKPGFYLPGRSQLERARAQGIAKVFRASTNTGIVARASSRTTRRRTKRAVQAPVAADRDVSAGEFDARLKSIDWMVGKYVNLRDAYISLSEAFDACWVAYAHPRQRSPSWKQRILRTMVPAHLKGWMQCWCRAASANAA